MSTEKTTDIQSSAEGAELFVEPGVSEDGNDKTVEVSEADLADLGRLLQSYKSVILAHEDRLLEHEGRITILEQKKPVKLEIPRGRSR